MEYRYGYTWKRCMYIEETKAKDMLSAVKWIYENVEFDSVFFVEEL